MSRKHRQFALYSEENDDLEASPSGESVTNDDVNDSFLLPSGAMTSQDRRDGRLPRESWRHAHKPRHSRGPPSVDTLESLSTIPNTDLDSKEVQGVYTELQEINDKLKREFKILTQRDLVLKQKEQSLSDLQMSLETAIDNEVKRRLAAREQEYEVEFKKLDASLKEKSRENRRLKENFDALKNANDILRRELDTLTASHDKLEKQHNSVQARLINLQRKIEHNEKKDSSGRGPSVVTHVKQAAPGQQEQKHAGRRPKVNPNTTEVMASLLDWVCESQLRQPITDQPTKLIDSSAHQEQLEDRCFKMLPTLMEVLRDQVTSSSRLSLPSLQFIYWSLVHLEGSQSQHQKTSLSSSLRRLGEELYRGRPTRTTDSAETSELTEPRDKPRDRPSLFYRSGHLHTRLLSSLVILKTVSQVDYLAQVYESLRNDLKSDSGKEYFLYYQATGIMLSHLKPANKTLTSSALDVYLQMAMDSLYLRSFLDSCSVERWFQAVSLIWRMPAIEAKLQEKISILLQKLSKIRSNKKYFEVFGLTTSCQEVQRSAAVQSPFLSLNLKSILYNLNVTKTQPKGTT